MAYGPHFGHFCFTDWLPPPGGTLVTMVTSLSVLQVQMPSQPSTERSPVLQPRTLVLTGTDVFLLDEDYVSYPLPDFAKEPPSRWDITDIHTYIHNGFICTCPGDSHLASPGCISLSLLYLTN